MRATPALGPRGHHEPPAPPPAPCCAAAAGPHPGTCVRDIPLTLPRCPLKVGGSGEAPATSAEGIRSSDREYPGRGAPLLRPASPSPSPLATPPPHPIPWALAGRSCLSALGTSVAFHYHTPHLKQSQLQGLELSAIPSVYPVSLGLSKVPDGLVCKKN